MSRIMVVDDEATITTQLEERLGLAGYNVVGRASSGEQAIEMARNLSPDLILMDIVMPGKFNGIEASEIIRDELDIPIIFLTAYASREFLNRAKYVEPFGYIVKPFEMTSVKAAIDIALYKKEQEKLLKDTSTRYKSMIDYASDMIIRLDSLGNIIYINKKTERLMGYTIGELFGTVFDSMLYTGNARPEWGFMAIVNNCGKDLQENIILKKKNGEPIGVTVTCSSVKINSQELYQLILRESSASTLRNNSEVLTTAEDISIFKELEGAHFFMFLNREDGLEGAEIYPVNSKGELFCDDTNTKSIAEKLISNDGTGINDIINKSFKETGDNLFISRDIMDAEGRPVELFFMTAPLVYKGENLIMIFGYDLSKILSRIRSLESAISEKSVIIRDIHHRIKNNLQIISSLLNLQSRRIDDENTLKVLNDFRNRVNAINLIHDKLSNTLDKSEIELSDYLNSLAKNIFYSCGLGINNVELKLNIEKMLISSRKAVILGLIVNELVTNSIKYAFDGIDNGEITVEFLRENPEFHKLIVSDNGKGLPLDFDLEETGTLGFQLVTSLVKQLDGKITRAGENGIKFIIEFRTLLDA